MAEPFYLKCPCGGEWMLDVGADGHFCRKCKQDIGAIVLIQRYAEALGLAVEALEEIEENAEDRSWSTDQRIAIEVLRQIYGKETDNG